MINVPRLVHRNLTRYIDLNIDFNACNDVVVVVVKVLASLKVFSVISLQS